VSTIVGKDWGDLRPSLLLYFLSYGLNLEINFFNVTGKLNNPSKVLLPDIKYSVDLINAPDKQSRICW
jgi:hypothetical protein